MRIAIYYVPDADDPLHAQGSAWLGRDIETGRTLAEPAFPDLARLTASPRRYGFHATLKAPFTLAGSLPDFLAEAEQFASALAPVVLPPLEVAGIAGFAALCLVRPCPALSALACAAVTALDHFRLPEAPDQAARRAAACTPRQQALLARWGYPFVLEEWRFHMTLSNVGAASPALLAAAASHFKATLSLPRQVRSLAICIEPDPGEPFRLAARLWLAASQ